MQTVVGKKKERIKENHRAFPWSDIGLCAETVLYTGETHPLKAANYGGVKRTDATLTRPGRLQAWNL